MIYCTHKETALGGHGRYIMNKVTKLTMILSKIFEILHWIGSAIELIVSVLGFINSQTNDFYDATLVGGEQMLEGIYVFAITLSNGKSLALATILVGLTEAGMLALMALVFRSVWRVMKRTQNGTPFQPENVSALKRIGVLALVMQGFSMLMGAVVCIACIDSAPDVVIGLDGIMLALVVFCLTQFFARGVELENEVDGLV